MEGDDPEQKPEESAIARPGLRESFLQAEARAREVLRARGLSEELIEAELRRVKREQPD